jgi:hypothetical protein
MSENELLQWVGVGVGGVVGGAVLYGLVRFVKQQNAIWPDAATKYGLKHTQKSESIPLGNSRHFELLEGPALGVVSMNESIGRTRRRSTVITARSAPWPAPVRFDVETTRPAATFHLVSTGDPAFDARRFITSDSKAAVQAVLTPAVRAALLQCPQHTLRIHCEGPQVVVSFGQLVTDARELTGTIDLALALSKGPSGV